MRQRDGERYARLYETYWSHPKVAGRSLASQGLHARALSYSRHARTDGFIPRHVIHMFGPDAEAAAVELSTPLPGEENPQWHAREDGSGWDMHDFDGHQETEKSLEAKRKVGRDKKRAQRANVPGDTKGTTAGQGRDNARTATGTSEGTEGGCPQGVPVLSSRDRERERKRERDTLSHAGARAEAPPRGARETAGATAKETRDDSRDVRQVFRLWAECWTEAHGDPPMLVESANWQRAFEVVKLARGLEESDPRFNRDKFLRVTMAAAARDEFVASAANPFAAYAASPDGALRKAAASEASKREASGWS